MIFRSILHGPQDSTESLLAKARTLTGSSDKLCSRIDKERHERHRKQEWKDEFQQIYNGFSDKAIYNAKPFKPADGHAAPEKPAEQAQRPSTS